MVEPRSSPRPCQARVSDQFLQEQYAMLRRQNPLMYALMFIAVLFVGMETFRDVRWA